MEGKNHPVANANFRPPGIRLSSKQLFTPPRNAESALETTERCVLDAVTNTVDLVGDSPDGKCPALPSCLAAMDTTFFSKPAKKKKVNRCTPTSRDETHAAISKITDLTTNSSDSDSSDNDYIYQLVEKALRRSFNETGARDVIDVDTGKSSVKSAIKRVNMITDNPSKVYDLVWRRSKTRRWTCPQITTCWTCSLRGTT